MKLVRRARKSIRERRMKACINDLSSNLAKVELRVFKHQKSERDAKRRQLGIANPVPKDVLMGKMNPELYRIECQLHDEAGLPKPRPYLGYHEDAMRQRENTHRIGFVTFSAIVRAVQKINK